MTNEITSGISTALSQEFGEAYEIYKEPVTQGLKKPCFSITCVSPSARLFVGKRYFRQNQFCIQYFPQGPQVNEECNEVLERLFCCLEIILLDGEAIRGTKMTSEIKDGMLKFFLNFDMFVYQVDTAENVMDSVDGMVDVKKDCIKTERNGYK